jgi:alpha-L-fucosidase
MWFDHVGGRDWGKWKFDRLFSMMYRHQPELIVNNRAAAFCGPATSEDSGPPSPEIEKMGKGDYYTPEGSIGAMDIAEDWESCIHVGEGWSYRGEDGFSGPEDCIKMLVSCTTGGGNLLLNFGPRPDGTFADGEADVARAMGEWLKTYSDAIYGTRGGPYRNGKWGGTCHRDNKLFFHVYEWPEEGLSFDPLPVPVQSACTLTGAAVDVTQTDDVLSLNVDMADRVSPVTVLELTLDGVIESGSMVGVARASMAYLEEYGELLSKDADLRLSSSSEYNDSGTQARLFDPYDETGNFAFHTQDEENPWAIVDLGDVHTIKVVEIENCPHDRRSEGLILSLSEDGQSWDKIWQAERWESLWKISVTHFHAGIDAPGRAARYLKVETEGDSPRSLQLRHLMVYGLT